MTYKTLLGTPTNVPPTPNRQYHIDATRQYTYKNEDGQLKTVNHKLFTSDYCKNGTLPKCEVCYPKQSICIQCNQSGHSFCNKD
ncbi:MAG: hypothetical protein U1D31_03415 [Patescibacteria group bacterium]|nr:hypothetical protein [Patescibacteria group bacterium]